MHAPPTGDDEPPLASIRSAARALSDRLLSAVRPIRVLEAVRWDQSVGDAFLAAGGRELPRLDSESYRPLPFDPVVKRQELLTLERDARRRLGRDEPLGRLFRRRCRQARSTVDLLVARGTPEFSKLAGELYGRPTAAEHAEVNATTAALAAAAAPVETTRYLNAFEAAAVLTSRLRQSFAAAGRFRVRVCDTLLSDAAACGRSIKLHSRAQFSHADLALLEVHEGWVHLGTTINARRQSACSFLSFGPPATTASQEGLAVLCELLSGVCHGGRVRRLKRRYDAVRLAESGADFRDVYHVFLAETDNPRDAYHHAARIFRGSLPSGCGPFAKDATYLLGLVRLLRAARSGKRLPALELLFSGKVSAADLPLLSSLADEGILSRPGIVPVPFRQPAKLAAGLHALPHTPHPLPPPHVRAVPMPLLPPDTALK